MAAPRNHVSWRDNLIASISALVGTTLPIEIVQQQARLHDLHAAGSPAYPSASDVNPYGWTILNSPASSNSHVPGFD
jgi:hypothetical protein